MNCEDIGTEAQDINLITATRKSFFNFCRHRVTLAWLRFRYPNEMCVR